MGRIKELDKIFEVPNDENTEVLTCIFDKKVDCHGCRICEGCDVL